MSDTLQEVKIGHPVPDFAFNCYDPVAHDFPRISLEQIKQEGKWTILFFYPADFTFV